MSDNEEKKDSGSEDYLGYVREGYEPLDPEQDINPPENDDGTGEVDPNSD